MLSLSMNIESKEDVQVSGFDNQVDQRFTEEKYTRGACIYFLLQTASTCQQIPCHSIFCSDSGQRNHCLFRFLLPPSLLHQELWIVLTIQHAPQAYCLGKIRYLCVLFIILNFILMFFISDVSHVLFPFPFSLKVILAFHSFNHYSRRLALCGQTSFSTFS